MRDRATFADLRVRGRRARRGAVSVVYLDAPGRGVRVAYAIGKRTGGAVVRNRIRRRLRAALTRLAGASSSALADGAYLFGAGAEAASLPFDELVDQLRDVVERVTAR